MSSPAFDPLAVTVGELRDYLSDAANRYSAIENLHPDYRHSARNLIAYMALRQRDLQSLQAQLGQQGLSSLGRSEAHVLASIEAVFSTLCRLSGHIYSPTPQLAEHPGFNSGPELLEEHARRLLGPRPTDRDTHIMVTMPGEAADNYTLVEQLLLNGMDCMRINCAHDGPVQWQGMIANLQRAQQQHQLPCKISMDLGGPKLRTAAINVRQHVIKIKPQRDRYGRVISPARIHLMTPATVASSPAYDARLCFTTDQLGTLRAGDILRFDDSRDARRQIQIVDTDSGGLIGEIEKTAYISSETVFKCLRKKECIGQLHNPCAPTADTCLILRPGDTLNVCRNPREEVAAEIGCTIPEVLDQVKPGERIWFDDGKIGGVVESTTPGSLSVKITHADSGGSKLRNDKGINLPDSHLSLPALTEKDLRDLEFVARHADIVALSFANTVADVRTLCNRLRELEAASTSIILKIETPTGFKNLPAMLLEAMTMESCGVMIARGDLAIEMGFERLAEVQEEILWICEAAHVPVVWATQVLETLAKSGAPTRAEISDAALGHRADCVMLNKGDHIGEALMSLREILRRMQTHEQKKFSLLRPLSVAGTIFE